MDDLRAEFLRLLTVDSETKDRRRRDFNQAIFNAKGGWAVWSDIDLDMVMGKFDEAVRLVRPADASGGGEGRLRETLRRLVAVVDDASPGASDASGGADREWSRLWDEGKARVQAEHAARYADLFAVIEYADTRTTAVEEKDGAVEVYGLRAADWNRIVAVARGHKTKAAQRVIDRFHRESFEAVAAPSSSEFSPSTGEPE